MAKRRHPHPDRGELGAVYRLHWGYWLLLAGFVAAGLLAITAPGKAAGIGPGLRGFLVVVCAGLTLWILWLLGHRIELRTKGVAKVTPFRSRFVAWDAMRGLRDPGYGSRFVGDRVRASHYALRGTGGRVLMTWSRDHVSRDHELAAVIRREIEKLREERVRADRKARGITTPRRRAARIVRRSDDSLAARLGLPEANPPDVRAPRGRISTTAKIGAFLAALCTVLSYVHLNWTVLVDTYEEPEAEDATRREKRRTVLMVGHIQRSLLLHKGYALGHAPRDSALYALPAVHPDLLKRGFVDNGVNTPIEVLHACWTTRSMPGIAEVDMRVGDTDGDGQPEFVDERGCPLVYFPCNAVKSQDVGWPMYRRQDGVNILPTPHGKLGEEGDEVFGIGPDCRPNTGDDVRGTEY